MVVAEARPSYWRGARRTAFYAVAGTFSCLLSLTFLSVTAVTIGTWFAGENRYTTPVSDLAFFALGATICVGLVAQLRDPGRHIAALQQSLLGSLALAVAGLAGARIEPLTGGVALVAVAAVLLLLHPARTAFVARVARPRGALLALSLVLAAPATVYAARMLALARDAGPSCFFGQCPLGDRYAEMAALAIAIVLVGSLAAWAPAGERLAAWSAGVGAALFAAASIVLPEAPGSLGVAAGVLAAIWSFLFVAAGEYAARTEHRARPEDARRVWHGSEAGLR